MSLGVKGFNWGDNHLVRLNKSCSIFIAGMCSEASITTHPAHTTKFTTGTDLSLRCRCRSSSTGTVRWIKNGVTFSPANGHVAMDHKKLNINSTTFADSGNYTCYVTIDKLGTAKSEKLEIWGKYKKKCLKNKRLSSFYNFACGFCIVNKMNWIEKKMESLCFVHISLCLSTMSVIF